MAEEPNNAHPAGASAPQPDAAMNPSPEQPAPPADRASDQSSEGAGSGPQGDLEDQLADAQARAAEYHEAFLRARAEMDNVRRRAQEDVAKAHKFAVEGFAESLLPVIDSLEAALRVDHGSFEAMRSGVELTLRQLMAAFERNRLVPVDPAGQRFDPNLHQAISMAPSDTVPPQHVAATLQKGFTIADRVLRPALVTVSQGPQSGA